HDWIQRVQRPTLPTLDLLHHRLGDVGNQRRTYLYLIDLFQVPLDLARAHPSRIHRDDLVVETGKSRLAFADDLRLVTAVAIPRGLQRHLPEIALERLGGSAIDRVAAVITGRIVLLVAEMVGHLNLHRAFQQRLGQLLQQTVFPYDVFWLLVVRQ